MIDHIIPITLDIWFGTAYFRKYLLTFLLVKFIIIFVKSIKPLLKVFTITSKTMAIILSTLTLQQIT